MQSGGEEEMRDGEQERDQERSASPDDDDAGATGSGGGGGGAAATAASGGGGGGRRRSRSSSRSSKDSRKSARSRSSRSAGSRSRSRSRSSERDGYRLHIADIGEDVRKSDLEKVFSQYGTLKEIWMTNSTPCFGFAVFKERKAASAALKATDGMDINGTQIHVTHARPRTRGSGRRFFNPNMRCYQCGYSGHFYRDCPELNGGGDKRDRGYDRRRHREHRERDYYERDYGRRSHRSSRRYDDYRSSSRRTSRRSRY